MLSWILQSGGPMEDKHEGNLTNNEKSFVFFFFFLTKGCFALKGYRSHTKSTSLWDLQDLNWKHWTYLTDTNFGRECQICPYCEHVFLKRNDYPSFLQ